MREKKGTTLIEMMVAIAILAFVALAVIMALVSIQQAWLKQKSGIELFNNARWAMESMVNEIRQGCNYTVYAAVGVDGLRFRSPSVADTEYIFYWRGNGTAQYGNSDVIFRGVGADLSSASSSSSRKEVVNLVANTNSVFSLSDNNLVAIELTVRKGGRRSCVLKSKACPRNRDPYAKLLIHADEPNGSTFLADSSPQKHTITAVGSASTSNAQIKFGRCSAAFDGNGDYLSVLDSDDWNFDGDFTIDYWLKFNVLQYTDIIGQAQSAGGNRSWWWQFNGSNQIFFSFATDGVGSYANPLNYTSWAPVTGQWYHMAVTRSGSNWYMFIDGAQVATGSNAAAIYDSTSALWIGNIEHDSNPARSLNGWIDELRISKGIARWTSNFTRPSMDYQN